MIRDADVSIYALTVYAALSSRSGLREIIPGQATLAREARCSERQVRRALTELEDLGVVSRVRRKNASGRAPDGYTLHPNGGPEVADSQSATTAVADSGDAGTGLGEQGYRTEAAITPLLGRDSEVEREEVDRAIDEIWSMWPSARRSTRKVVDRSLRTALKVASWQTISEAARAHTDVWRGWPSSELQFVPLLSTWLNQERWTGEVPLPRAGRMGAVDAGRRAAELLAEHDRLAVGA
jgi:hypothetical protein